MRIIITEEQKKKLFIPRRQSGEDSKWNQWNKEQPVKDGIRINQYDEDGIKTGIWWEYYYSSGNIMSKGTYVNGKRNGIWEWYKSNGKIESKGPYKNEKEDGVWEWYHSNGNIMYKGPYKNGGRYGLWEWYYNNGNIRCKGFFNNGLKTSLWEYYDENGNLYSKGLYVDEEFTILPLNESKTSSFLLKEEMILIKEGNIQNYVQNVLSKIKNLPYETKKKYITIAISTLLGYTSYPVIQSMFNKTSDKDVKEIVHNVVKKKKDPRFKDPTKMRLSSKGWNHIKSEETLQLKAYSIGDGMITVGYGHAEPISTSKYKVDQQISKEEADSLLGKDLKGAADGVRRIFKDFKKQGIDVNITQDMFDALVSMAFNSGVGGLRRTEVIKQIKNNNLKKAGELIKITNVNKKFPGLLKRRDKESDMFLSYLNQSNTIKA